MTILPPCPAADNSINQDELAAAIDLAEAQLANPAAEDPVAAFLAATAGTRPAPGQPGTLGQQLEAAHLFLHISPGLRRKHQRAVWAAVRDRVFPHRRPLEQQAKEWAGGRDDDGGPVDGAQVSNTDYQGGNGRHQEHVQPSAIARANQEAVKARKRKRI